MDTMSSLIKLALLVFFFNSSSASEENVIVKIAQGELEGSWKSSFGGRKYASFQGVPFAEAPVGVKRYMEPQPPKPWEGVWQAKNLPNECIQWSSTGGSDDTVIGDEDCLYLNVYTPKPSSSAKLPVIVYIHGGAFIFGSGIFYGPEYLMDKNVVYVSINYRLGAIGFLSTQDDVLPGNNGMKDQVMALRWVKDNIEKFGGDPDSVTAMGMSAGGASVNYLLLSPLSQGLIHRGISESGTACCPWTLQTRPREKAILVASALGCSIESSKKMIDCLNNRPASAIVRTIHQFMPFLHSPFSPFAPVVEPSNTKNAFLTEYPYKLMLDGKASDVPWLNSVTTHEGIYPAGIFIQKPEHIAELEERWVELVPHLFDFNDTMSETQHASAAKKIKDAYMDGKPISYDTISGLIDAFSDRHFVVDVEKCAKLQAAVKKQPVYFYQFGYSGAGSLGYHLSRSDKNYGVSHGDDTGYIIKTDYMDATKNDEDIKMIKRMTTMIAEFATNGTPKMGNIKWSPLNEDKNSLNYMSIFGPNEFSMKKAESLVINNVWSKLDINENENYIVQKKDEL